MAAKGMEKWLEKFNADEKIPNNLISFIKPFVIPTRMKKSNKE